MIPPIYAKVRFQTLIISQENKYRDKVEKMMEKNSGKKRYPINSFIFRVSIHYNDYFPKDKFLSYVENEDFVNSCVECKNTCQYYLDITLPCEYKYKYLQEDITSVFPSLLHINTGVISYELCRPKEIIQQ